MRRILRDPIAEPVIVAMAALGSLWYHVTTRAAGMNNYAYLAAAWAKGRSWIDYPGEFIDAVPFHGRAYIIEAPLPAVLMLPLAFLQHEHVNESLVGAVVFSIGCGAIVWIARDLGFGPAARLIFVLFAAAGTSLYFCAFHGDVWYLAHVCGVTFSLLAIALIMSGAKPELIVLCGVCAGLSRFTLMPVVLLSIVYMLATRGRAAWRRIAFGSLAVLVPVAALMIWYNEARWGVPYDLGYSYFYRVMIDPHGSPFGLRYLPNDLWNIFARNPGLSANPPFVAPLAVGPGLLWMSWPLGAAAFAREPKALVFFLWAAAVSALVPNLVYFSFGDIHFGSRHALDFIPFLLVLTMLAVRPKAPRWLLFWMTVMSAFSAWLLFRYESTF